MTLQPRACAEALAHSLSKQDTRGVVNSVEGPGMWSQSERTFLQSMSEGCSGRNTDLKLKVAGDFPHRISPSVGAALGWVFSLDDNPSDICNSPVYLPQ